MITAGAGALVGRDDELAELSSVIGLSGEPARPRRSVLVSGDAGVGKTRLLGELRARADVAGWTTVTGHCLDLADAALPYLPVSEILGHLATGADGVEDGPERDALDHPALARLQPGRRVRGGPEEGGSTDRAELFAAVHTLLERAGGRAPLLVVIEDLHWADPSTRDLLGYLFTRGFTTPVAVVASYRSDDLHRRHPLRAPAAEWARLPGVHRLQLAGLTEPAVRRLIDELAPGLDGAEVADVVRRADGNAFFVEELLASCDAPRGAALPESLTDVLLVRLDRLDDAATRIVRLASVAGREVAHDVLAAVSWLDGDALEAGIRQAVEMNVLSVVPGGYAFRHALLAEAAYDDLLPGERVRLHAAFVTALTSGAVEGTAAELARHALLAHDRATALAASLEAGDEARSVGGPEEAARHYEQALGLAVGLRSGDPSAPDVDVARIAVSAASALRSGGNGQRAAALLTDQLDRLPAGAPPTWRPLLLSTLAVHLLIIETDRDCVALSTEAVGLLPDTESELRAELLSNHARVLENAERLDDALVAGMAALRMAEHLDLPVLASEITTTLSRLRRPGEATTARRALEAAVEQAAAVGALDAELRARYLLARSYEDACEWEPAGRWCASAMERGDRAGLPWSPYVLESRWKLAQIRLIQGRWDEVLELCAPADHPQAPAVPRAMLDAVRLAVHLARGERIDDALAGLRDTWELEGAVIIHAAPLELRVAGRRGDDAALVAAHQAAVGTLERIWHPWFSARIRLAAVAIGELVSLLPALTASRRTEVHELIDDWYAGGATAVDRYSSVSGLWGVEGQAWYKRLEAETLRARWTSGIDAPDAEELLTRWHETEQLFLDLGHEPELAVVRGRRAGLLRTLGRTAEARGPAELARATADRLGADALLDEPGPDTGRGVLTPREHEVLELVAAGRSNAEIGRALFISTKTVSVHVSNVLAKLEASSRTEAAALARRRGLIG